MFISTETLENFCIVFFREKFNIAINTKPPEPDWSWQDLQGEKNQSVEILCCWPTWPVLGWIPDVFMHCTVSSEGRTTKANKAILLSHYFHITFSLIFQLAPTEAETQRFGTWWVASVTATQGLFFQSVHRSPLSEESELNALTFLPLSSEAFRDYRGLWEM